MTFLFPKCFSANSSALSLKLRPQFKRVEKGFQILIRAVAAVRDDDSLSHVNEIIYYTVRFLLPSLHPSLEQIVRNDARFTQHLIKN